MKWVLISSLILFFTGLILRLVSRQKAEALGVAGDLVYIDQGKPELLVSDRYGLVGRPDYILRDQDELVPVERKSRALSERGAHDGEILQLAAYCLLTEERFDQPVRRGRLLYSNGALDISFDEQLRRRLAIRLEAMRKARQLRDVPRSHNSVARCRMCGFRKACDQSLA